MSGIYIHIPFCKQACHYCDFHFSTSLIALVFSALYIPDYYGKRIVVEELDDTNINSDMKKV
jgi:hypothetical protein